MMMLTMKSVNDEIALSTLMILNPETSCPVVWTPCKLEI